jgi:GNAT superfamily N-acetyltransferase
VSIVSLGYQTDLMLLGLQRSMIEQRTGGYQVVRTPTNPTFYWGNFLLLDGPPGPGTVASWMSTFASEFPGTEHVAIGVDGTGGDAGDPAELGAAGLAVERNAVLTGASTTPPPRPNEAAQYRVLDSDGDWDAALELQEAVYSSDHKGWQGFTGRRLQAMRRLQEQGSGVWFGAFEAGRMVSGLGVFGDGSGIARFQNVDTHPEHRNKGLAGTLVHKASQYALQEMAAQTLVIVADPDDGAIRIYRSVGFKDAEIQVQLQSPA